LPTSERGDIYKFEAPHDADMRPLGVVGPDQQRARLIERLTDRLDGAVAVVRRPAPTDDRQPTAPPAGAATAHVLGDDGAWTATGRDRSVADLLGDLAVDHEYALLSGFPDADVPQVALADADPQGEVLAAADGAAAVDVDAVVAALHDRDPFETLSSLVAAAKASPKAPRSGAIATFTGRVRAKDGPDDDPTEYLEFERYDEVAGERMARIETELCEREGVHEVLLHHRTGVVEYGEDIVFVVVLAGHREEAFQTVEDGINRLKDEVPLFKREVTVDEEFWVHDRA
jgi:molybdopterin synthase catalytic subunit